jgi:ribonuclease P protein component
MQDEEACWSSVSLTDDGTSAYRYLVGRTATVFLAVLSSVNRDVIGEHNEQAHLPTEQPSPCEGPRFPPSHAHACGSRHLVGTSPQGPHRTLGLNPTVLSRARRIVNPLDFKRVVRSGTRITGSFMVMYLDGGEGSPGRAGFIVAKTVGGATTRNLVKRRLRAVAADVVEGFSGDLVVRAFPTAASATFADLRAELVELLERAQARRTKA